VADQGAGVESIEGWSRGGSRFVAGFGSGAQSTEITERPDDVYSSGPAELDTGLAALHALAIDEDW
jgi:hypothetical protein